jgi:glucosamine--fructose-6-phosphate aminotransferase (isomerizing)
MDEVFLEEILSQPQVLRAILDRYRGDDALLRPLRRLIQEGYDLILLTGMGTSYFALYPACIYLNARGVPAVMLETSELLHYYQGLISDRVLVVIVSQSGETIEAKRLLEAIDGRTLAMSLTNNADSEVARRTDLSLLMYAGEERGPASKSYTASLLVLLLCAMAITSDLGSQSTRELYDAVDAVGRFLERREERIDSLARFVGQVDYLSLLGRGPSVASTAAGSLILKEVAKVKAEAMSSGQFRHGPLEVASPGFLACVFAPEGKTRELNLRLAYDIARFGGRAVVVGGGMEEGREGILHLPLPSLSELHAPIVEIVPLQLLAHRMALDKGLPPGKFERAGKVTLEE